MFCPKCGNNLPENAGFCGKCGTSLKAAQQTPAAAVASATPAKKTVALIMIALLVLFSVLPIIFWFCENAGIDFMGVSETGTWNDFWPDGDDRTFVEVFRWIGIAFLAINIVIGAAVLATGKYKTKRTRFIFSRFASIVNLIGHVFLYIAFLDEAGRLEDYAFMSFSGVMFIISCVVLFVLPFFISHATKQPKK